MKLFSDGAKLTWLGQTDLQTLKVSSAVPSLHGMRAFKSKCTLPLPRSKYFKCPSFLS